MRDSTTGGKSFGALAPLLVLYDIVDAPRAANRSNQRHGFANLGLIPVVAPGGPAPYRGLALAGQS